jgi:hypothetical protein
MFTSSILSSEEPARLSLDPEDFRRLGIRPFECRQTVIRLAAIRTSRSLAQQQLFEPTSDRSLQLSQVATSTYRLLDPRGRIDPIQRAVIGRIMPHALSVAGKTRFFSEQIDADVNLAAFESFELEESLDDFSNEFERQPKWTISLSEQDLLAPRPPIRVVRRAKRRSRLRRFTLLGILLFSASVSTVVVAGLIRARGKVEVPRNQDTKTVAETRGGAAPLLADRTNVRPLPRTAEERRDPQSSTPAAAMPSPIIIAPPLRLDESTPAPPPIADEPLQLSEPGSMQRELMELMQGLRAANQTSPTHHPLPTVDQVDTARRDMLVALPFLAQTVDRASIPSRIDQLRQFANRYPAGSAEHWTAMQAILTHRWLLEEGSESGAPQIADPWSDLSQQYEFSMAPQLSASFADACLLARMPETYRPLAANGLRLCDQFFVAESFDECQGVIESLRSLATEYADAETLARLEDYAESILQADRLADATRRWIDQLDKSVANADTGIAGRYYCLLLRRWDVGLPWLATVSDVRMARLAEQELAAADVVELIDIADRWLDLATRHEARAADSMRLHAIDLLRESLDQLSAIARQESERRIELANQKLPLELRTAPGR